MTVLKGTKINVKTIFKTVIQFEYTVLVSIFVILLNQILIIFVKTVAYWLKVSLIKVLLIKSHVSKYLEKWHLILD